VVDLNRAVRGRAWKFGDSIDTNQLAGGGLRGTSGSDTLKINCLRGLRPEFPEQVKPDDILVAGDNFGCGSSRETAVEALQLCGIGAVVAESVARIHRRNSIALALPTYAVPGITAFVEDGDEVEVDYRARVVRNLTRGGELALPNLSESVEEIYEEGGISEVIRAKLAKAGIVPGPRDSSPVNSEVEEQAE
jgi:3-isopropylmalate/(R)-2-methylmalate dehydratase small subunit